MVGESKNLSEGITPEELHKDRTMKLISFSIKKKTFSVGEALNETGMGFSEFVTTGQAIYTLDSNVSHEMDSSEVRNWNLKPDALFGYMGLIEFEHSVKSAQQAKNIAIWSIFISGILAVGSLGTSLYSIFFN
ncbi:hypothetical protein [Marinomonas aquiplantarum]|uniref:Uncharacterized protein n=1 Tax=Marinomonas aquiplantarum TaxID=491951 RepID=A0A366CYB7_9GAMM|nr:hypothetical protein [Marinomonas aquiplantarum]RBO82656.1 hypothetical protein DFP76_105123 [Marinomonas aquiplantarum]